MGDLPAPPGWEFIRYTEQANKPLEIVFRHRNTGSYLLRMGWVHDAWELSVQGSAPMFCAQDDPPFDWATRMIASLAASRL